MRSALREVPEYAATAFRPKQSDYCVAVVAVNENGRLHEQLGKMKPFCETVDVVIADGGSTDGSVAREIVQPLGVNTLLTKLGPGKLGAQMRMAFAWALDRGYRGVITMDGNNKDGPEAIPRFLDRLEAGYDHLQGSRFIPGGLSENLPLSRWLGIRLIHAPMIRWASGFAYTDTTNGFRGYSARFLAASETAVFRDVFVGYELLFYLAIRAARLGFKVAELPVSRRYPPSGPIPTKISPIRGTLEVLRCLLAACLGRYDPKDDRKRIRPQV
jgi:dolichol-phosphate mannosyltransferase